MSTEDQFVTTKAARPAMEKHIQFWDRKNKGYITPVDTVFGFIHLGYGIVISVTLGTFVGMLLSYSTQDSWMPDPMLRTRVEKWRRKDAAYQVYDKDGQLDLERFDELFEKHAKSDIGGQSITIKELLEWNEATYKNPLAWTSTALEWLAIYLLVGNKGTVTKQDIRAAYDGTLFYQVRDRKKTSRSIQGFGDSSSSSSASPLPSINIYGVKVPGSYIQHLETRINKVVQTLPHPTVSILETRLKHWLSFTQRQQDGASTSAIDNNGAMHPILKGVATPSPIRRSLFSGAPSHGSDESLYIEEKDHWKDGLTGVMAADNKTDQFMSLSGVQGYVPSTNADETTSGNDDELFGGDSSPDSTGKRAEFFGQRIHSATPDDNDTDSYSNGHEYNNGLSFSMAGVRSENTEDSGTWLHSGQLTGVSPSPSAASNLADQQNNDSTSINDDSSSTSTSNDNDRECATFDEQSISLGDGDGDSIQLGETPPLTENGSVYSDLDDMMDNSPAKEGQTGSTMPSDTQPPSKTPTHPTQHTYTITIPQNGTTGNNEPSNGSKSSKKSKKNKKKKNRQQQAPTPPAKDHSVDDYISQQQSKSLSLTTPAQHLMTQ